MKTVYTPKPPMKKSSLVYSLVVLAISMVQAFAVTITPKANTITFASPRGTNSYSTSSLPLTASVTDGGTITFSGSSSVGSVSGNTLNLNGSAGTISIVATESSTPASGYAVAKPVTNVVTITQRSNSITFTAPNGTNNYTNSIPLTASVTDGGSITFSGSSSVGSVSGSTLNLNGTAGTIRIVATEALSATGYKTPTPVTNTITIKQFSNSITFTTPKGTNNYASSFSLNATALDGGTVTFSGNNDLVGTVSGNTFTPTGKGGTISIVATEASPTTGYATPKNVTNTITIKQLSNSITFTTPKGTNNYASSFSLSATALDGGTVTFSGNNDLVGTVSGNTFTPTGKGGTISIVATEASPITGYATPKNVTNTITIKQLSNAITTSVPSSVTYSPSPISLSGTATDGGSVTFSLTNSPIASVSGNQLTLLGPAGTIKVVAQEVSQMTGYAPPAAVTNTIVVSQLSNSIAWSSPSSGATVSRTAPVSLSASATDNGSISYSIATADSAKGTCSGSTLTLKTNSTGTIHLVASEATAATGYAKAVAVTNVVTISTNGAITPTISPVTIGSQTYSTNATVTVSPTSTSLGAITLSVSGPATVSGTTVTLTGAGIVTVSATQAASGNYTAVTSPVQVASFTVSKGTQAIAFPSLSYPGSITLGSSISVPQPTSSSGLSVSVGATGAAYANNQLTINAGGTVTITATQAGNANFNAATPVSHSFSVNSKGGGEYSFSPVN